MPTPYVTTLYIRNGRYLPGPSMDAEAVEVIEKWAYNELVRKLEDMEAWTEPKPQIEYGLRHMQARIEKLEAEIERLKGEK